MEIRCRIYNGESIADLTIQLALPGNLTAGDQSEFDQLSIGELAEELDSQLEEHLPIASSFDSPAWSLFYGGKELQRDDLRPLSSIGIRRGSTIIVSQRRPRERRLGSGGPDLKPEIWELHPQHSPEAGGIAVQIRGQGFPEMLAGALVVCKFGNTIVSGQLLTPNIILTKSPPHDPGPVTVQISINGSSFTQSRHQFVYLPAKPLNDSALSSESSDDSHRNNRELMNSLHRHRKQD